MKKKTYIWSKSLQISNLFVSSVLFFALLASCYKDSEAIVNNSEKELITIDNLGEVHNYLLATYESSFIKSTSSSKTFGDIYNEFEIILLNSEKYSTNTAIESGLTESEKLIVLNNFATIQLDTNFHKEFEKRFLTYFQNLTNIDEKVKFELLHTINDYSSIDNLKNMENYSGYDLILAYSNVYNASLNYWSKNSQLKNINMPENQAIIWADAAGAAIGLGCGGLMSILMAAAASNMVVEAYEMN